MNNLNFKLLEAKLERVKRDYKAKFETTSKVEVRFTMSKNEIDESLPNIHWVLLDLGVPDGCNV